MPELPLSEDKSMSEIPREKAAAVRDKHTHKRSEISRKNTLVAHETHSLYLTMLLIANMKSGP